MPIVQLMDMQGMHLHYALLHQDSTLTISSLVIPVSDFADERLVGMSICINS